MRVSLLTTLVFTLLVSCSSDYDEINSNDKLTSVNMLAFKSENDFSSFYEKAKENNNHSSLENIGVRSLKSLMEKSVSEIHSFNIFDDDGDGDDDELFDPTHDTFDEPEEVENFILDDTFASLLNDKGEIKIGTDIYKYTDVGLFKTNEDKLDLLNNFLERENIKSYPERTDPYIIANYIANNTDGEFNSVNDDIDYYYGLQPPTDDLIIDLNSGNSVVIPPKPQTTNPAYKSEFQTGLKNLETRKVHRNILGNIFGNKNYVTYYQYKSKRRIKVKYYYQNYKLVYAVGTKVKNQKKGWTGIWRAQSTGALALGIKTMSWEFPSMNSVYIKNHAPYSNMMIFANDKVYKLEKTGWGLNLSEAQKKNYPALPPFFYKAVDALVEIVLPGDDVTKEKVDEIFYKEIMGSVVNLLSSEQRKVAVIVGANDKFILNYYDLSTIKENTSTISRTFDWGISTPPITYIFGTGFNINVSNVLKTTIDFQANKPTKLDMYGMVYDGKWKGVSLKI